MEKQKPLFRIVLTEQAKEFIDSLPLSAREKMDYIIYRVAKGEKNKEIFKKLDDSDNIWEFRVLHKKIAYRLFAFWDTEKETLIIATHGIIKKNAKNTGKRNRKSRSYKERIF